LTRFLIRLANQDGYKPKDVRKISRTVRNLIGSEEKASHFRIGSKALEFNLFVDNEKELDQYKEILQRAFSRLLLVKELDRISDNMDKNESFREGIGLFNEERFWESHEILEQAWKQSQGSEKDNIQGIILTAAAFVHQQKGENDICLSILARAKSKLSPMDRTLGVNTGNLQKNIEKILETKQILPFQIQ
jgi:hypothetical protein